MWHGASRFGLPIVVLWLAIPGCALASPAGNSWSELPALPTPRRLLAAAAVGSRIYTFGGCGSPCFEPPLHSDAFEETRVEVYDQTTGAWSARRPLPAILFGAAAAAVDGRIFVFGGYLTGSLVLEYDPATDAWAARESMPTPRFGLAVVALDGKIYALGGSDPGGALEVYDPALDSWSRRARLPAARVFLAAAALGGKIYAIGGSPDSAGNSQTDAVEVYDPAADSWTAAAPLPAAEQLSAAVAADGKLYAFGGFVPGAGVKSATYQYDPATDSWSTAAPMPMARDQAPAVLANGAAYVLGGSVNCHCRAVASTESYVPASPLPSPACLQLSKTASREQAAPGDALSYRIEAANCGTQSLEVTVTDAFRETGLLDGAWCRGAGCLPAAAADLVDTVALPAGGAELYTVAGTVPCGPRHLANTACAAVAGEPPVCATDTRRVAAPSADLQLSVAAPASAIAGLNIAYRWTVANLGPCPAEAVSLTAQLPRRLTPVGTAAGCAVAASVLTCLLPTPLPPANSVSIQLELALPCDLRPGSLTAPGVVASTTPDPQPANNSAAVLTAVDMISDYSIDKRCPAAADANSFLVYTLSVCNRGPSCAPANVSDLLPGPLLQRLWCSDIGCIPFAGSVTAQIGIAPGMCAAFQLSGRIDPTFTGPLTNTATVIPVLGSDPFLDDNGSACTTLVSPLGCVVSPCGPSP